MREKKTGTNKKLGGLGGGRGRQALWRRFSCVSMRETRGINVVTLGNVPYWRTIDWFPVVPQSNGRLFPAADLKFKPSPLIQTRSLATSSSLMDCI